MNDPLGDEGLATLLAPPPQAGALPPPTGGLTKLKLLHLSYTQVTDAGCATLTAALHSDVLPALEKLDLDGIPASRAARNAVQAALPALLSPEVSVGRLKMHTDETMCLV